jgi:hypothetical protein
VRGELEISSPFSINFTIMISTKNIISSYEDVPSEWIFEYYLNLSEKLVGQDVKMYSVFKTEKTPSMYVYFTVNNNSYKFKDFSSGNQGGPVDLVMALFSIDFFSATSMIINDYERFIKDNRYALNVEYKVQDKYKVVDYEMRHWTNLDKDYWMKYKIGSKLLEYYNVTPLSFFSMEKTEPDGSISSVRISLNNIYGYFRRNGSLYKIYMPKNGDKKFIKVENYIQGSDQLVSVKSNLIITASLKDLMAFRMLKIPDFQAIAPDSENSMINESAIDKLKEKFDKIVVLFDNDTAGKESSEKYKSRYGFDYITLDMSKDLSDSVKDYGIDAVRDKLKQML